MKYLLYIIMIGSVISMINVIGVNPSSIMQQIYVMGVNGFAGVTFAVCAAALYIGKVK